MPPRETTKWTAGGTSPLNTIDVVESTACRTQPSMPAHTRSPAWGHWYVADGERTRRTDLTSAPATGGTNESPSARHPRALPSRARLLIARGHTMTDRDIARAEESEAALRSHQVQDLATNDGSTADECRDCPSCTPKACSPTLSSSNRSPSCLPERFAIPRHDAADSSPRTAYERGRTMHQYRTRMPADAPPRPRRTQARG